MHNAPFNNIGVTGCAILIITIIMFSQIKTASEAYMFGFSTIIILFTFLLIYWWNYHITQTYRKFLRKNELDSLNLLLEERNREIDFLKRENDKMARLIHKDNKIIPALSIAVMESTENKTLLDLSRFETDSPLYLKLKQLRAERIEMLETYHEEILNLPKTGLDSVDATISLMQTESLKLNIPYQLVLYNNAGVIIPAEIPEDDYVLMLSDLLANAINACKDIPSSSIQIYLGKIDGISAIKIYNTGKVFDIETLKNLGLARHTTHADTGGSGIGLMEIWRLKEKHKATLLIDEIVDESPDAAYTCMNILFNHKNHYMIQSNRHKELNTYINRPDVMIISKD